MIVRNGLCFLFCEIGFWCCNDSWNDYMVFVHDARENGVCCSLVNVFHLNVCVVFIVISLFYSAWN